MRLHKLQVELLQQCDTQAKFISELFEMEANMDKGEDLDRNGNAPRPDFLKQWGETVAILTQRYAYEWFGKLIP